MDDRFGAEAAGSLEGRLDLVKSRRLALERRLEDGYRRIDEALLAGSDVERWEEFWIQLLGEYEAVCQDLDLAA